MYVSILPILLAVSLSPSWQTRCICCIPNRIHLHSGHKIGNGNCAAAQLFIPLVLLFWLLTHPTKKCSNHYHCHCCSVQLIAFDSILQSRFFGRTFANAPKIHWALARVCRHSFNFRHNTHQLMRSMLHFQVLTAPTTMNQFQFSMRVWAGKKWCITSYSDNAVIIMCSFCLIFCTVWTHTFYSITRLSFIYRLMEENRYEIISALRPNIEAHQRFKSFNFRTFRVETFRKIPARSLIKTSPNSH